MWDMGGESQVRGTRRWNRRTRKKLTDSENDWVNAAEGKHVRQIAAMGLKQNQKQNFTNPRDKYKSTI